MLAIVVGVFTALATVPGGLGGEAAIVKHDGSQFGWRLVVFEQRSCSWCIRFRQELAPGYLGSKYQGRAPLTYVTIRSKDTAKFKLKGEVRGTPTFVLVDGEDQEIGRFRYPHSSDRMFELMDKYIL